MADTSSLLKRTSFASKPTSGLETIDVYNKNALEKIASPKDIATASKLISETYPNVKASQVKAILSDSATTSYLAKHGLNLNTALSSVNNSLPPNVAANDLLGDISLTNMLKYNGQFKNGMNSTAYTKLGEDGIKSLYKNFSSLQAAGGGEVTDSEGQAIWSNGGDSVTGVGRSVLNPAIGGAIAWTSGEKMIASGISDEVFNYIDNNENVKSWAKKSIFNSLLLDAGQYLAATLISKIIEAGYGDSDSKRKTAKQVLQSYSIAADTAVSDYPTLGADLVTLLDKLQSDWDTYIRNTVTIEDSHLMYYASEAALKVLSTQSRTMTLATMLYRLDMAPKSPAMLRNKYILG